MKDKAEINNQDSEKMADRLTNAQVLPKKQKVNYWIFITILLLGLVLAYLLIYLPPQTKLSFNETLSLDNQDNKMGITYGENVSKTVFQKLLSNNLDKKMFENVVIQDIINLGGLKMIVGASKNEAGILGDVYFVTNEHVKQINEFNSNDEAGSLYFAEETKNRIIVGMFTGANQQTIFILDRNGERKRFSDEQGRLDKYNYKVNKDGALVGNLSKIALFGNRLYLSSCTLDCFSENPVISLVSFDTNSGILLDIIEDWDINEAVIK